MKKMIINLVVDESSSMGSSWDETIGGFNEYIDSQKKHKDVEILVSLTKFSDEIKMVYCARPIEHVEHLDKKTYAPSGMTALYDAIAKSIRQSEIDLYREGDDTRVLFVVFTDGYENASQECRGIEGLAAVRKMIKAKQSEPDDKWTFVFFGTDMDAWGAAGGLGVAASNTVQVSRSNTRAMYSALANSTSARVKGIAAGESLCDFLSVNKAEYQGMDKPKVSCDPFNNDDEENG